MNTGQTATRKVPVLIAVAVLCMLSAIIGAFLGIALASANLANTGLWLRDFAKSPGATATAALVAASLAFWGISRQVTVSRQTLLQQREVAAQTLEHQQKTEESKAWWATFEWSADRGIPSDANDTALPLSVSMRTFEQLQESAQTNVQKAACGGVMDVLAQLLAGSRDSSEAGSANTARTKPGDSNYEGAVAALSAYVEASRGTAAASPGSEARLYELEATSAVEALNIEGAVVRVTPTLLGVSLDGPRRLIRPDAIVEIDGQSVVLEFKKNSSVAQARRSISATVADFRARGVEDPIVVVTPLQVEISSEWSEQNRCVIVQWRSGEDSDNLRDAISEAAARFGAADASEVVSGSQLS